MDNFDGEMQQLGAVELRTRIMVVSTNQQILHENGAVLPFRLLQKYRRILT